MLEHPDIIKYFSRNPSYENYTKIRKYIDPKIKVKTYKYKIHYSMFLYIIDKYYPLYKPLYNNTFSNRIMRCFKNKINLKNIDDFVNCRLLYKHIMDEPSLLCVTDLEILWLLLYATGDNSYSEQVKLCAITKKHNIVNSAITKHAAMLSYNNHITQNIIKGPKIKMEEKSSITDPLFFSPNNQSNFDKLTYLYGDE